MKSYKQGWRECQQQEEKNNLAFFCIVGAVIGSIAWMMIRQHLSEVVILEDIIYQIYG